MEVTILLERARDLISDPAHWTVGVQARDSAGTPTNPRDLGAVRWCAVGAVSAAAPSFGSPLKIDALVLLRRAAEEILSRPEVGPEDVNDHLGHEAVMHMFNRAIEFAREHT